MKDNSWISRTSITTYPDIKKQAQESLAAVISLDNIKQTTKINFKIQSSSSQVNTKLQFRT